MSEEKTNPDKKRYFRTDERKSREFSKPERDRPGRAMNLDPENTVRSQNNANSNSQNNGKSSSDSS